MKEHISHRSEYLVSLGMIIILLFLLWFPFTRHQPNYTMEEVQTILAPHLSELEVEQKDASFIRRAYGLSQEDMISAIVYGHSGAMDVEEIAVFEVTPANQDAIVNACEKRRQNQIISFQGYGEAQVNELKQAQIKAFGSVVVCVTSPQVEEIMHGLEVGE